MSERSVRKAMADAYLTLGEALGSVHELEATIVRLRDRIVLATTMYDTGVRDLPDEAAPLPDDGLSRRPQRDDAARAERSREASWLRAADPERARRRDLGSEPPASPALE